MNEEEIVKLLRCPRTGAALTWYAEQQKLVNERSGQAYPRRQGIWILLPSAAEAFPLAPAALPAANENECKP